MGLIAAVAFGATAFAEGAGAISDANAQREQGKYQQHMYETNAKLAEDQAADAIRTGNLEAGQVAKKASAVRGSQRAAFAAQGIDVNSGVAAEVQSDTVALSKLDELTIKENAFRKAWGYKVDALNSRSSGEFAKKASDRAADMTLLTGGLKALGSGMKAYQAGSQWDSGGGGPKVKKYAYDERQS